MDGKGFDLDHVEEIQKVEDEGVWVDIIDPRTDAPSGTRIKVAGSLSKRWRRAEEAYNRRMRKLARAGVEVKSDEVEKSHARMIADATIAWENLLSGGQELPFSVEAAEKVYLRAAWLCAQVHVGAETHTRFFTPTSSDSSPTPGTPEG